MGSGLVPAKALLRVLAVAIVWIALGVAGPARATQIGISDACPAPPAERNAIFSDGDEPVMRGTAASDLICGDSRANLIIGGLLDDEIYGGGGADILIGGHGTDVLDGGSGSDWLRGGDGQDCYEGGHESARTTDTVSFADATPTSEVAVSGVVVDLSAPDTDLEGIVPPSCELHGIEAPAPGRALGQGSNEELNHIDRIIGSAFDDTITAGAERLATSGGFGDDVLNGTGGDDNLWGDGGLDRCTNDGATIECLNGVPEAHRFTGALVFAENRLNGTDFGLVVLGREGTANDTLEVTRANERQLRVTGGSNIAPGSPNCRRGVNERTVDCELSAARYVVVWGDAGDDTISTAGDLSNENHGTLDANGGPGNDNLTGHGSNDVLFTGEGGIDTLTGNGGSDALISEGDPADGTSNGADTLDAGDGDDQLVTDNACAGHRLQGGEGWDIIGFARQTRIGGVSAGVRARLGDGTTSYSAAAIDATGTQIANCVPSTMVPGGEVLEGTNQADDITGNSNRNSLWGRKGNDSLHGLGDDDVIKAQEGSDEAWGDNGADNITGGDGEDHLYGEDGADSLYGQNNNDILDGAAGDDLLNGGASQDSLEGGTGLDTLKGEGGNDGESGGPDADVLWGEAGDDGLEGGTGNDTLYGGEDNDTLDDYTGIDWFYGQGGRDVLLARDFQQDNAVNCGEGEDEASRDASDPVISCER
jgi:Ca2+-binding RTX toxin-like protein